MPPALSDYDSDGYEILISTERRDYKNEVLEIAPLEPNDTTRQYQQSSTCGTSDRSPGLPVCHYLQGVLAEQLIHKKQGQLKSKKRTSLLAGLDSDNIIAAFDEEATATTNTSPTVPKLALYNSRPHRHSAQKSELCYDQAYHPMDDHVQPKRASRVKMKYNYEIPDDVCSDASIDDDETDKETDVEEHTFEGTGRKYPRRSSAKSSAQPTRWSFRKTNKNAIYDGNIHPQDIELKELEDEDRLEYPGSKSRKRQRLCAGRFQQEQNGPETDCENTVDAPIEDCYRCYDERDTDTLSANRQRALTNQSNASIGDVLPPAEVGLQRRQRLRHSCSSSINTDTESSPSPHELFARSRSFSTGDTPPRPTTTRSISILCMDGDRRGRNHIVNAWPKVSGAPFSIYDEAIHSQEAALASPPLETYYSGRDDDKENKELNPELAIVPHPHDGIQVHRTTNFQYHSNLNDDMPSGGESTHFAEAIRMGFGNSIADDAELTLSLYDPSSNN